MKKINIAYFGSPDFSANFLEKILLDKDIPVEVKLVVTQPDSPVGRKQILTPTPVKKVANKYKIPVISQMNQKTENRTSDKSENRSPKRNSVISLQTSDFGIPSSDLSKIDLTLVYAYGDLIPREMLSLPKYGFWNIHPSLLPKYRGPSPIATPLINGDKITGVTIIKMDDEIDHGPIIAQESLTIQDNDYRMDLEKKLTDLGFEMFRKLVLKGEDTFFETIARGPRGGVAVEKNGIEPYINQNHQQATYTKKLTKQDGFIKFEELKSLFQLTTNHQSLVTFYNLFRALSPWPGIWTILPNGKRLKITQMSLLQTTNYQLQPIRVQLEGKSEVDFPTFNQAYKIF